MKRQLTEAEEILRRIKDYHFLDDMIPLNAKPYPNEHAARIRQPDEFKEKPDWSSEGQFARTHGGKAVLEGAGMIDVPRSIDIIWGQLKNQSGKEAAVQALRFPIDTWTSQEAKDWLKEHKIKYVSFEPSTSGKMKFKDFKSKVTDVDDKGIVTIYVNAFNNTDSYNEISMPGSFDKTIAEGIMRIKHLKDHNRYQLLGLPLEITPDNFGLKVVSAMNLKKEMVKDVFEDYKFFADHKRTLEHSIGYQVIKSEMNEETGIRKILEYKLYEYSTLSFLGANPATMLVDLKDTDMLNDMLRNGNYTDEHFKLIELILNTEQSQLQQLYKTLTNEPLKDTQKSEPSGIDYNFLITNLKT